MCLSKAAYDSPEAAFQKNQRVYKCDFCYKYHRSGTEAELLSTLRKGIRHFVKGQPYRG